MCFFKYSLQQEHHIYSIPIHPYFRVVQDQQRGLKAPPHPNHQGFCKPVTCSCFPFRFSTGWSYPFIILAVQKRTQSCNHRNMDVPVDIFCLLCFFKRELEPYLLPPQHCHKPRLNKKILFFILNQCSSSLPLFLPSLQRWIEHGLAWEPWTLGPIKLSFATINSWAIKQTRQPLPCQPHPRVLSSPIAQDGPATLFPPGAICSFPTLLLKNCLIKITRV